MDSCNKLMIKKSFWKLDKFDKIVIALWFIGFSFFCIGDCFAVDGSSQSLGEAIPVSVVSDLTDGAGTFVSYPGVKVYYYHLISGHRYILYNNYSLNYTLRLSSEIPSDGVSFSVLSLVPAGTSYSFIADDDSYLYVSYSSQSEGVSNYVFLYDISQSMSASVDSLVNNVGQEQIWSIFDNGIPIALLVVLVAFGIFIIGFASRKIQKGKMGI